MSKVHLGCVIACVLVATPLAGCGSLVKGPITVASTPAECKQAKNDACVIEVVVKEGTKEGTDIGVDCRVAVAKDFDLRIPIGNVDEKAGRQVVWRLKPPAGKESEFAFVDDLGVFALPGADGKNTEFTKRFTVDKKDPWAYEWVSKRKRKTNESAIDVAYSLLVTRTTGTGDAQQVRVCENADPVIYND